MSISEPSDIRNGTTPARTVGAVLRPIYLAAALVGLAVPLVSLSLIGLALFLVFPFSIASLVFSFSVLFATVSANLANLIMSLWALRASVGPIWFRNLIGIAAVISGIFLATAAVLLGMFATLGG